MADFRLKCFFFLWGARRGFTDRLRDPIETALPYFGNFSQKKWRQFFGPTRPFSQRNGQNGAAGRTLLLEDAVTYVSQ